VKRTRLFTFAYSYVLLLFFGESREDADDDLDTADGGGCFGGNGGGNSSSYDGAGTFGWYTGGYWVYAGFRTSCGCG